MRIKDGTRASILKMLDIGAMGLIIPNLQSYEEAVALVKYGKYFPVGERGVAPTVGSAFWYEPYAQNGMKSYFETCNREQLLIPQCELWVVWTISIKSFPLRELMGFFVGPYDLSTAMGKPGEFDDPAFKEAMKKVLATCKKHKKYSFIFAGNVAAARQDFEIGYDSVAYGMDSITLVESVKQIVKEIKN